LPVQVETGVTQIAAGGYNSIIIKNNGSLMTCGYNGQGQLGNGTFTNRDQFIPVNLSW
jgi:alpha-tubulin suppressor-like RCC1 family protein